MKKNTKKKGFTLIELIAVIAILAILGAVLVPRIGGYMDKANKSNLQSSAKTMVHAIQAFNADATAPVINGDLVPAAVTKVNAASTTATISTTNGNYTNLAGLTVAQLCGVANGTFTYAKGVLPAASVTTAGDIAD